MLLFKLSVIKQFDVKCLFLRAGIVLMFSVRCLYLRRQNIAV